ncbi:hypothetical protein ACTPOK_20995 [Streptomyces inhibens]|uniref:hypothetical protein n=1 Tax=Streptomyces inhibens TaxID=2293571 RepID=UPI00402AB9E1
MASAWVIEADEGPDLAREVVRDLVVFMQRPGGRSQFSVPARAPHRAPRAPATTRCAPSSTRSPPTRPPTTPAPPWPPAPASAPAI